MYIVQGKKYDVYVPVSDVILNVCLPVNPKWWVGGDILCLAHDVPLHVHPTPSTEQVLKKARDKLKILSKG